MLSERSYKKFLAIQGGCKYRKPVKSENKYICEYFDSSISYCNKTNCPLLRKDGDADAEA